MGGEQDPHHHGCDIAVTIQHAVIGQAGDRNCIALLNINKYYLPRAVDPVKLSPTPSVQSHTHAGRARKIIDYL